MATTLLALDLLPAGKYELVTFGAPTVFYGTRPNTKMHLLGAKIQQWVNEEDPIPRILGSDYDALLKIAGSFIPKPQYGNGLFGDVLAAIADIGNMTAEYSKGYVHLDNVKWIRNRASTVLTSASNALRIRSMSVNGTGDHYLASYKRGLESLLRSSRSSEL